MPPAISGTKDSDVRRHWRVLIDFRSQFYFVDGLLVYLPLLLIRGDPAVSRWFRLQRLCWGISREASVHEAAETVRTGLQCVLDRGV